MSACRRSGFSLLEVLVAASMMLGSVIVLGHLLGIGRRHAVAAEELSRAQRLCQNRLAEIVAGVRSPEPVTDDPFPEEPGWLCTTTIDPLQIAGLSLLRVVVAQEESSSAKRPVRFELVCWLRGKLGSSPQNSRSAFSSSTPGNDFAPGSSP